MQLQHKRDFPFSTPAPISENFQNSYHFPPAVLSICQTQRLYPSVSLLCDLIDRIDKKEDKKKEKETIKEKAGKTSPRVKRKHYNKCLPEDAKRKTLPRMFL